MNISEETIDLYLRGDLSGTQLQALKKAMDADPKLKQEINFQSDVVNSLKSFRHQQLKSRFDKLEIPAGASVETGFVSSIYMKFAASILVVALLIGGASIWMNNNESATTSESNQNISAVTTPHQNTSIIDEHITPAVVSETAPENGVNSVPVTNAKKTVKKSSVNVPKKNKQGNSELSDEIEQEDFSDETLNADFEMPTINDGTSNAGIQNVKVNIVKEKNLGYRFFNNQLFLHGNFSNSTYELFELNNAPNKQLYLYFEHNYYELIQGKTKVTSLNPITNKATLVQLNQLRER